ncbi:hypothetical protein PHYSODRAFT_564323 [Phytophthora sojae]|uniref:HECT-type E3 ubiquitin transferase n=1 Tax=Phytophthora sojae (strain P6497) TaxID=1094619 RepID=G5A2K6_PHYSP|nr:hypothetical protein PHYSODRAFT_564323 [Phytophthora sojae]EGZ09896.1 hypothetical protein PHYSODRAFT_564323 [Phytophthora sojae]|eukprot:XP_009534757.1 hypothetical protein PHYSODRAFT_564323 [Phytophthora sojae]
MFLRDNELARGAGGGGRRGDRARVLQLAKEQREARGKRKEQEAAARQLQAFVRGRLAARRVRAQARVEFDQKLGDIANLKAILQLPSMPLPYDALFELLRLVLFFYTGGEEDAERLLQLSSLFGDSLAAARDGIKGSEDKQRDWQLRRFVDLCLQCSTATSTAVEVAVGFKTARELTETLPEIQQYLLSGRLVDCHPLREMRKKQYFEMPKASVTQIVRQGLISARGQLPISSRVHESSYSNALLDFVVYLLTNTSGILEAFVMEVRAVGCWCGVLSVPLLNKVVAADPLLQLTNLPLWIRLLSAGLHLSVFDFPASPVTGIASEAWFLGNLLWISDHVEGKTDAVVLNEVQLLSKLLQSVPPATYAASGVAVSWTKVSESHSVPVVFPEALNEQLQILVNDQYLRSMCNHLLSFSPSALRHPLGAQRPVPMYPEAPTIAEQFGFGDIASSSSLSTSLSVTWQKMKSIGKASWARSLFEKAGLRRRREGGEENSGIAGTSQLPNTSRQARHIAARGVDQSTEPFILENIKALSCLCGTFLFRWGSDGGKRQSYAMRLLNTLAFYHVEVVDNEGVAAQNVSLVHMLWCVLQDTKNFEDFAKNVDLMHARSSDPYVCMLVLFCMTYEHLLVVMDDEEMYEKEYPLPLCEVERIVLSLKRALHEAYWTYANLAPSSESVAFGMFVVEMATRLMRVLYNRCSRQPFCNVTSW